MELPFFVLILHFECWLNNESFFPQKKITTNLYGMTLLNPISTFFLTILIPLCSKSKINCNNTEFTKICRTSIKTSRRYSSLKILAIARLLP